MDQLNEEVPKFEAAAAVAEAAIALKNASLLTKALDIVYPLGEELFEEDNQSNPAAMAYSRPGFESLCGITRLLAGSGDVQVYDRVATVRNTVLKSYLLAELADGAISRQQKRSPLGLFANPL